MQNIWYYTLQLSDLNIETKQIEELLGYQKGECPEPFPSMISDLLKSAKEYCCIEGGYVIYNHAVIDFSKLYLKVDKVYFNIGKTILSRLRKSESILFFKCTAGKGIDEWSKKLAREGDILGSYLISIIGSTIVETAMDKIQYFLKNEMTIEDLNITNRYSPGYCGWKVAEQLKLFKMFPADFCNISLTESMMMDPVKSISGIIGVGRDVKFDPYTCNLCNSLNCLYKNLKSPKS
jgi:hypothetical protein